MTSHSKDLKVSVKVILIILHYQVTDRDFFTKFLEWFLVKGGF